MSKIFEFLKNTSIPYQNEWIVRAKERVRNKESLTFKLATKTLLILRKKPLYKKKLMSLFGFSKDKFDTFLKGKLKLTPLELNKIKIIIDNILNKQ